MNDKLLHDILTKVLNLNKYTDRTFAFDIFDTLVTVYERRKEGNFYYANHLYKPGEEQLEEISNQLTKLLEEI